jgi:hypothetical protein
MEDIELGALRFRKHPLLAYRSNHCPQNKAPRALAGLRRTLSCEGVVGVRPHLQLTLHDIVPRARYIQIITSSLNERPCAPTPR